MTARRMLLFVAVCLVPGLTGLVASPTDRRASSPQAMAAEPDCGTTGVPSRDLTYTYRSTDPSGVSTLTRQWLEYTETSSKLRMIHAHPRQGTTTAVTTARHHFEDDLVVVDAYETVGTHAAGAFTTKTVHKPGLIDGPAVRVCRGKRWTISPAQVTTTVTPGGVISHVVSGSGEVLAIHESVTVPAGTFDTVHYKQTQNTPQGTIVTFTWRAIKEGVNVRWELAAPGGSSVEVLTSAR